MATATLTREIECTGIHGITGQQIDEGTLPAGTVVKDWKPTGRIDDFAVEIEFLSRDGKSWFIQRTWSALPLDCGDYAPTVEDAFAYA